MDTPPPAFNLRLYGPVQQMLHRRHTRRVSHLVLGMVLPEALLELVPRGGPLRRGIDVHTAPTDPELTVFDGASGELYLGRGWGGRAVFLVGLERLRDGGCHEGVSLRESGMEECLQGWARTIVIII